MVTDCDGEELLYHEYFTVKKKYMIRNKNQQKEESNPYVFSFIVSLFENLHPIYYIKIVSDRWLQSEIVEPLPFKNLILPE